MSSHDDDSANLSTLSCAVHCLVTVARTTTNLPLSFWTCFIMTFILRMYYVSFSSGFHPPFTLCTELRLYPSRSFPVTSNVEFYIYIPCHLHHLVTLFQTNSYLQASSDILIGLFLVFSLLSHHRYLKVCTYSLTPLLVHPICIARISGLRVQRL